MAKLDRKLQKVFASNASDIGQFGSGQEGTNNLTTDVEEIQALSNYLDGWLAAVKGEKKAPPMEDFNGLQYITSYLIKYLYQEGIPEYYATEVYYANSIVKKVNTTELYKSLTDNNTGNALTDTDNWVVLGDLANLTPVDTGPLNQYGQVGVTSVTSSPVHFSVSFDTEFTSTVPYIYCTVNRTGGAKRVGVQVQNRTATGFDGYVWNDDGDSVNVYIMWHAVDNDL